MIKLSFMFGREVMNFAIKGKEIYYQDRIFFEGLRCIPKDEQFIKKIINSRNKYSPKLLTMFNLSETQQKEYNAAKDEIALADIIIKDCHKKGISLLKKEEVNDGKEE